MLNYWSILYFISSLEATRSWPQRAGKEFYCNWGSPTFAWRKWKNRGLITNSLCDSFPLWYSSLNFFFSFFRCGELMVVLKHQYPRRTLVNFTVEIATLSFTRTILVKRKKITICAVGSAKIASRYLWYNLINFVFLIVFVF